MCVSFRVMLVSSEASAEDRYSLNVDLVRGTIEVSASLDNVLAGELVCLPAFGQRYGEYFYDIRAQVDGHSIGIVRDRAGCYRGLSGNEVFFQYRLEMRRLPGGRFWLPSELSPVNREDMLAFPGESLFVERGANRTATHQGETIVEVIGGGDIVTTLPMMEPDGREENAKSFVSGDPFSLTRSFWTFGTKNHRTVLAGPVEWELVISDDWQGNADVIQQEISHILSYYAELMPKKTPGHIAVFLSSVPFDSSYAHGIARPGGVILELGRNASWEESVRRVLMAHELFHLYNGEGFRFDSKSYELTAWFREGMTQYVAYSALLSIGLITKKELYDWMAKAISRQKKGQYDAYFHGFFLSLAIEQQWQIFKTDKDLLGFWKYLSELPGFNSEHDNRALRTLLTSYSAFNFNDFFQNYVSGKKTLPIEDILRLNGLAIHAVRQFVYTTGLEYALDAKKASLVVKSVVRGSPSEQAGVKVGDVIVPSRDTDWHDRNDVRMDVIRGRQRIQMRIPTVAVPQRELLVY